MMYPVQTNSSSLMKRSPVAMALLQAQQGQTGPIVQKLGGPQSADPNMASPRNFGEGISALGDGLAQRQRAQAAMFPNAPGNEQPSLMMAMKNLFSGGNNGGLY